MYKRQDYYDLNDDGFYQGVTGENEESLPQENDSTRDIRSITNEEMAQTLTIYPNLVAPTGAFLNLSMCGLINDDELVVMKSTIDDLPDFQEDKPNFTPVDDKNVGSREELNWLIKDCLLYTSRCV